MPTPNWGPQAGIPMDDATFSAYVSSNPPGQQSNNVFWGNTLQGADARGYSDITNPLRDQSRFNYWSGLAAGGPQQTFQSQYQTANQDQARAEQQRVIQALQAQAAGDPNSQAQQQLGQAYQGAQSQQSSLGSTMRGQSAGAAMRGIQAGQQGIQRSLPGDQQMLMLQEQQAAQAMLAQLLAQQQGQDITQAQGMASASLGADGLNDALRQFYLSQGIGGEIGRLQTMNDYNRSQYGFDLDAQNIRDDVNKRFLQAGATTLGTAGNLGAGWLGGRNEPTLSGTHDEGTQHTSSGGSHG